MLSKRGGVTAARGQNQRIGGGSRSDGNDRCVSILEPLSSSRSSDPELDPVGAVEWANVPVALSGCWSYAPKPLQRRYRRYDRPGRQIRPRG